MNGEASYVCDGCGEDIIIPIDPSAGQRQRYVEDCPVCCRPNIIDVVIGPDGQPQVSGTPEQDRY